MDRRALLIISLTVISALAFTSIEGCDLKQAIKLDTPSQVDEALALEGRQTLADADMIWHRWEEFVSRTTLALSDSIEDSENRYEVIRSLVSTSLDALGNSSASFPGGLMITSALAALGGLFLNKPGAKKREYAARAEGYRQGLEEERRHHANS
tara:strand:+ start:675 stop:1136 length:462 start_codon:yes stop_codon:yes gene_type:complete